MHNEQKPNQQTQEGLAGKFMMQKPNVISSGSLVKNPTLLKMGQNTQRLQKEERNLKPINIYMPNQSKKRTLLDLEDDLENYRNFRGPLNIEEFSDNENSVDQFKLPSPIFRPDIFIPDEQTKQLMKPEEKLEQKKDDDKQQKPPIQPVIQQVEPIIAKELYLPPTKSEVETKKTFTPIDEAEIMIKRENELIELREILRRKEEKEALISSATREIKKHIEQGKIEVQRKEMIKSIPSSESARLNNFFEVQPHFLYQRDAKGIEVPKSLALTQDHTTGHFPEISLAYAFTNKLAQFWRTSHNVLNQSTVTLNAFTSDILNIFTMQHNKKPFVLVFTSEEIWTYEYKPVQNDATLNFKLELYDRQTSDRTRYDCLFKTQKKGRLFIGGERGQVSEIQFENNQGGKGYLGKIVQTAKRKIMGEGVKMRKIDQTNEGAQGIFSKLLPSFLFGNKKIKDKVVVDITEDSDKNLLYVAITSSQNQVIEIYDLGSKGDEFVHIHTLCLDDIYHLNEERIKRQVSIPYELEVQKLKITNKDELTIVLSNATIFVLQITLTEAKNASTKSEKKKTMSFTLLDIVTPCLPLLISRYEDLFDAEFIPPDQDIMQISTWKPITANSNIHIDQRIEITSQRGWVLKQVEITASEKVVMLIQDTSNTLTSYLLILEPNWRRGSPYKFTQSVISITHVPDNTLSFALSQQDGTSRTSIQILTTENIMTYVQPTQNDLMFHYLHLMLIYQGNERVLERIKADFMNHLTCQSVEVSVQSLIEIIMSNRMREKFIVSAMGEFFYKNQSTLMSQNHMNRFTMAQINQEDRFIESLRRLIQTVKSYLPSEICQEHTVTSELQNIAFEYYILLTTSRDALPMIPQSKAYMQAQRGYTQCKELIREHLRVDSIYKYLIEFLLSESFLKQKLFKIKDKENLLERASIEVNSFKITQLYESLMKLDGLLSTQKINLIRESVESSDVLQYKDRYMGMYEIVKRCKEALGMINQMEIILGKKDLVKDFPKEVKDGINKLSVEDFIFQGLQNNEVCTLLELYFSEFDAANLESSNQNIRETFRNFIPDQAYSLIIGRRYLQQAIELQKEADKNKLPSLVLKVEHYRQKGFSHLRKHSESVNLLIGIEELIKNQMPYQGLALCLEAIENIESMRRIASANPEIMSILGFYQVQQNMAIDFSLMFLKEVINRLDCTKEPSSAPKDEEKELNFIKELRKLLYSSSQNRESIDHLKKSMMQLCMKSSSEIFHLSLYEQLYKLKNGLAEIKGMKASPYMPQFINKLNISEALVNDSKLTDTAEKNKEQEERKLTEAQQIQLFKSKLDATYSHNLALRLYADTFTYLFTQICLNPDQSPLDITQRLHYLSLAEGCLFAHQDQPLPPLPSQQIENFYRFKDYLHLILQLVEANQMKKQKKRLDEQAFNRLKNQLLSPDDACQIALYLREWRLYLEIILVNEVRRYTQEGKSLKEKLTNLDGTKQRIQYLYQHMIEHAFNSSPINQQKKFEKLKKASLQLQRFNEGFEKTKKDIEGLNELTLFPIEEIFRMMNGKTIEKLREMKDADQLTALNVEKMWFIDFLITEIKVDPGYLFNRLCQDTVMEKVTKQFTFGANPFAEEIQDPCDLIPLAYLALKHLQKDAPHQIGSPVRVQLIGLVEKLQQVLDDELIYSPKFIEVMRNLAEGIQSKFSDGKPIEEKLGKNQEPVIVREQSMPQQ